MEKNKILLSFIIIIIGLFSCKKEASYGGKAIVHVHVIDGQISVPTAVVKMKFNANSFPGAGAPYEDSKPVDYKGQVDFTGLSRGEYYFYAFYTDTSAIVHEGGIYLRINNKPGETHVVIDFSESDPF